MRYFLSAILLCPTLLGGQLQIQGGSTSSPSKDSAGDVRNCLVALEKLVPAPTPVWSRQQASCEGMVNSLGSQAPNGRNVKIKSLLIVVQAELQRCRTYAELNNTSESERCRTEVRSQLDALAPMVSSPQIAAVTDQVTSQPASRGVTAFGFTKGMTKAQIVAMLGPRSLTREDGDVLVFTKAPSPHPDFESYMVIMSPDGLVKVMGVTADIQTSSSGDQIKEKFSQFHDALSKKYGSASHDFDHLKYGSLWEESRYWMMGLLKKDRTLASFWTFTPPGADHIESISLEAHGSTMEKGWIGVSYEFEGFSSHADKRKAERDSVF